MQTEEIKLGRAARRKQEKKEKHKAKAHGVRGINTMEVAADRSATITKANQDKIKWMVKECFDAMKDGSWRGPEWNTLADTLNLAAALASPFNICSDHIEKFHKAMERMADVAQRVNKGYGWKATAQEINAMEKAIEFFGYQIQFASRGEYFDAITFARNKAENSSKAISIDSPKEPA